MKLHLQDAKLESLHRQLADLFATQLNHKWIDYSQTYGFGYQLCDDGTGVMFNDGTKLIQLSDGV